MRNSVIVLALSSLLLLVSAQPSGSISYTPLNLEEATKDQAIGDLFSFGAQEVLDRGVQDGRLLAGEYSVAEVYEIGFYSDETGSSFKFDVALEELILQNITNVTFEVWNATDGSRSLISYQIGESPYTSLDIDTAIDDPLIQESYVFGSIWVSIQGTALGFLLPEEYGQDSINYVGQYLNGTGSSYKFDVTWSSASQPSVPIVFTVWTPLAGEREVTSFKIGDFPAFGIDPVTQQPVEPVDPEEEQGESGEGESENEWSEESGNEYEFEDTESPSWVDDWTETALGVTLL